MWRRSGRSSAMDRAQVVLSVRRTGGGGGGTTQGSVGLSVNALLSDPSDPTSVSSAPGHGDDDVMSENSPGTERRTNKDLRPQSSLGGGGAGGGGRGGSRFLKKAPPPTNSSQSPVNRNQMQHPEPRYVTSSQRGCRTAALSRLAEIENRFLGRMQNPDRTGQVTKPALGLTSDPGVSAPAADSRTPEAPVKLPAPSGGARSPRGGRFLKNKAAGADRSSEAAPDRTDVGVGSGSRAADPVVPSVRAVSGVSLESDEEDMRKLLGDSADSNDCSFFRPARPSYMKETDQKLSRSSRRLPSSPHPPPAAVPPPSPSTTAPPRSTVSPPPPPRCSSPFRFTGQARACFSPSVLSSSPSPPPERPGSSHRTDSPAVSSVSGHGEVLSLEELFPVGPSSEGPHSEMSSVSCEDFKMNVMTLDDLVPAGFRLTAEKQKELKPSMPIHTSPTRHQQLPEEEEEEEEEVLDYQSDFESESRTEPGYSASQVSEHLQEEEEEEVISEVREEVLLSEGSRRRRRTKDDYSSAFSEKCSCASRMSGGRWRSKSFSRSRDSRSESPGSWTSSSSSSSSSSSFSQESRKQVPARKALKEAAVQTQPDPLAYTWSAGVAPLRTYMTPAAVVSHTVSAEMIEAISSSNTAAFTLTEMLKQQVAMTTHFIERNRRLHCSLLQSLEPPNYRYTTLEDTQQKICKNRCPGLTVEEALQEALQEVRDQPCVCQLVPPTHGLPPVSSDEPGQSPSTD
ncbi:uncharacterized protein C19orf44 homolog isoform X2 [Brachyistius frenatus]|uniref:uncharacterized protein C19orf44 homolog isoform X2 n=1 Tax=Brachyistius frenatus TaxID=100188 RepID=UPI0037E84D2A